MHYVMHSYYSSLCGNVREIDVFCNLKICLLLNKFELRSYSKITEIDPKDNNIKMCLHIFLI